MEMTIEVKEGVQPPHSECSLRVTMAGDAVNGSIDVGVECLTPCCALSNVDYGSLGLPVHRRVRVQEVCPQVALLEGQKPLNGHSPVIAN